MAANYQTIYQIIIDDDDCSPDIYSGGGGTLGISGRGCATRTLEPLAYTRAPELVSAGILLPYNRVNSPNHSYPRQLIISSSVL